MRLTDALRRTRFITQGGKKSLDFMVKIPITVEMAQLREMRRSGGEKVKEDLIFDDVLFAQIYIWCRLPDASLTHAFLARL